MPVNSVSGYFAFNAFLSSCFISDNRNASIYIDMTYLCKNRQLQANNIWVMNR